MLNIRFWTIAWFILCVVLALHVVEESRHASGVGIDVLRLFFPAVPAFQYEVWLVDITGALVALAALTWQVHRRNPWMRPASYAFALFTTSNAMLHLLRSLAENEMLTGAITAPALLLASLLLLVAIPRGDIGGAGAASDRHPSTTASR